MLAGTVREIKNHEYGVGLTLESVRELTRHGHRVLVERGAGEGIDATDDAFVAAGAAIRSDPHLRAVLNVRGGKTTHRAVADEQELDYSPPELCLA